MARKEKPEAVVVEATVNEAAFAQATESLNALSVMASEADSNARQVAMQLGYALPADSTDPDLIQRDIAANMRRSVESCLEVGKGLAVLKAACGHGKFSERLGVLGLETHVASRFISAARKFSNLPTSANLTKAIGTQSKLFELLVLDDGQVQELAEEGEVAGITLDDIEQMGVRELRTALRELREDAKAKDERRGELVAQNEKLKEQLVRIKREKPNETLEAARSEAGTILAEVLGRVQGDFRAALQTLHELGRSEVYMAGMVGQVGAALNELRAQFDLPDLSNAQDAALAAEVAQWAPQPEQAGA